MIFVVFGSTGISPVISRQMQIENLLIRQSKNSTITATNLLPKLHSLIIKMALDRDPHFLSSYVLFLASSSSTKSLNSAKWVFFRSSITPPLFAWNTIIRAFSNSPAPLESLKLFSRLLTTSFKPDNFTYPFVLKACGRSSMLGFGGSLHSLILKVGLDSDRYIAHTLIRMYGCFDLIRLARKVFNEMSARNVVSWSSMIAGYVACKAPLDALKVFQGMRSAKERPNSVTLVSLLSACMKTLDVDVGKSIHGYIITNSVEVDAALGTALLEMYSKCGHVKEGLRVFDFSIHEKNLQCWTVMISTLADHGLRKEAIALFNEMQRSGLRPDSMSFAAILSACSHLGLVEEGRRFFNQMVRVYEIRPRVEHYGCMVDMLGRAGLIEEAYQVIKSMPMEPNSVILRCFLGACRNSGRVTCLEDELGKVLLKSEPHLGANYVLAAGLSSLSGQWKEAADYRVVMRQKALKKVPGCSWVKI